MPFRGPGKRELIAERRARAFKLRQTGASPEDIARLLGVNRMTVIRDIKAFLTTLVKSTVDDPEQLVSQELDRLDRLQYAAWKYAIGYKEEKKDKQGRIVLDENDQPVTVEHPPDLDAIARVQSIIDQRARLLGLYKPVSVKANVTHDWAQAEKELQAKGFQPGQMMEELVGKYVKALESGEQPPAFIEADVVGDATGSVSPGASPDTSQDNSAKV